MPAIWGKCYSFWCKGQLLVPPFPSCCQIQACSVSLGCPGNPRGQVSAGGRHGAGATKRNSCHPFSPLPFAHFFLFVNIHSLLRRLVTLISQQATLLASNEAFKKQAESASEAAKKYMEENEQLKQVSSACLTPSCDILDGPL